MKSTKKLQCPLCRSKEVTAQKQGFGWGKAIIGSLILGAPGLVAGFHRHKDIIITCLPCGHTWNPVENKRVPWRWKFVPPWKWRRGARLQQS